MDGRTRLRAACAAAGLLSMTAGCISRAEYDKVDFSRRVALEHATQKEREAADERAERQKVEAERNSTRRELDTKIAMIENLNAETKRLDDTLRKTQAAFDELLKRGLPQAEIIVQRLPAQLDQALKEFAARYPEAVEYLADKGMVRWKSDLTFALGSDNVKDAAQSALREFAEIVNSPAASGFEVVICGHTDNVPIRASNKLHATNWHLSCHRAIAVGAAMSKFGVAYDRMGCMGFGEHRPREANPATGGNEKNRRVEIFLVPAKESFGSVAKAG